MEQKKKKPFYKKSWFWMLVVIVISIIAIGIGGKDSNAPGETPTPAPTATVAPTPTIQTYEDGQYKVGTDLTAGEYVLLSDSMAYFEIASDSTGQLSSIVANDNFTNRSILTVSDGQYLKLTGCTMYAIADAPAVVIEDIIPEGMYKVGTDIEAGEYKAVPDGTGYVEVSKDSSHQLTSIVSNDILSGEQYITVSDGQYIKLSGAHLLTK